MRNKILLYLVIIAVIDTVQEWLWWPWDHLMYAVQKLHGENGKRKEKREP